MLWVVEGFYCGGEGRFIPFRGPLKLNVGTKNGAAAAEGGAKGISTGYMLREMSLRVVVIVRRRMAVGHRRERGG